MSEKVKLTINGKELETEKGTTVLQAAKQIGIDIPTLCFLKDINQAGECRICIVEIEGRRGFVPSCRTIVEEGMKKGEIKQGNPKVIASEIYALIASTLVYKMKNENEIYNVNVFVCYAENLITLYISFLCFMML